MANWDRIQPGRRLGRLLGLGFLVGVVLPVSLIGTVALAVDHKALAADTSWKIVWGPFNWLLVPGDALLGIFDREAHIIGSHIQGWLFWREFFLLFIANWTGWSLLLALLTLAVGRLKRSRLASPDRRTLWVRMRKHAFLLRRLTAWGGFLGAVLPLFLLGLLLMSGQDRLAALVQEGGVLVYLLSFDLLPGEALLFPWDDNLEPFSGLPSAGGFWMFTAVLLLVNWVGWAAILLFTARFLTPRTGGQPDASD